MVCIRDYFVWWFLIGNVLIEFKIRCTNFQNCLSIVCRINAFFFILIFSVACLCSVAGFYNLFNLVRDRLLKAFYIFTHNASTVKLFLALQFYYSYLSYPPFIRPYIRNVHDLFQTYGVIIVILLFCQIYFRQ